jgi:sugar phosphate isomerase/epimerase
MGACRADLELLLHSLDIIGARKVVIWSGTHAATAFEEDDENQSEASMAALRDFVTDVVRSTQARRYAIVIEPWHSHVLNHEDRVAGFHHNLPPDVAERIRYVLDVPNLLTKERYSNKDSAVRSICGTIGPLAGLVHLKDVIMPPDGDEGLAAPGQGKLDYPAYVESIFRWTAPDAAAIVKNVPASEYSDARTYLLQLNDRWELT